MINISFHRSGELSSRQQKVFDQSKLDVTKRNLLAMNNFSIVKARDSLRQGGMKAPNDSIVDILYVLKPLPKYELKVGTDVNYSQVLNLDLSFHRPYDP
jgi:hypothetical protein